MHCEASVSSSTMGHICPLHVWLRVWPLLYLHDFSCLCLSFLVCKTVDSTECTSQGHCGGEGSKCLVHKVGAGCWCHPHGPHTHPGVLGTTRGQPQGTEPLPLVLAILSVLEAGLSCLRPQPPILSSPSVDMLSLPSLQVFCFCSVMISVAVQCHVSCWCHLQRLPLTIL